MATEMETIFGLVGTNEEMLQISQFARMAWDWSHLVEKVAKKDHLNAFLGMENLLKPFLTHTLWPDAVAFLGWCGRRVWPGRDQASTSELATHYMRLMLRVRTAPDWLRLSWYKVSAYEVQPVCLGDFSSIAACVGVCLSSHRKKRGSSTSSRCIDPLAWRILAFLWDRTCGVHCHSISPHALRKVGFPWRRCGQVVRNFDRVRWPHFQGRAGDFATIGRGPNVGKIVVVVSSKLELDHAKVSAAIDTNSYFSGIGDKASAWFAVRVHHRYRTLKSPEPMCERLGSQLSMLWDKVQGLTTSGLVDRLRLRAAGVRCTGSRRDEILIEELVRVLQAMGKNPVARKRKRVLPVADLTYDENWHSERLRCSLPASHSDLLEQRRLATQAGAPKVLSEDLKQAVRKQIRTDGKETILARLPVLAENKQTAQKDRSRSVLRGVLAQWLSSEEGQAWQAKRQAMYDTEELCEV